MLFFWKCGFWLSRYFEAWPGGDIGDMHTLGRWEDYEALLGVLASFFPQVIIIGARLPVLAARGLSSYRSGNTWKEPWLTGYNFFSCLIEAPIGLAPMFPSPHRLAEGERALWFSHKVLPSDSWEQSRDTMERSGCCPCSLAEVSGKDNQGWHRGIFRPFEVWHVKSFQIFLSKPSESLLSFISPLVLCTVFNST